MSEFHKSILDVIIQALTNWTQEDKKSLLPVHHDVHARANNVCTCNADRTQHTTCYMMFHVDLFLCLLVHGVCRPEHPGNAFVWCMALALGNGVLVFEPLIYKFIWIVCAIAKFDPFIYLVLWMCSWIGSLLAINDWSPAPGCYVNNARAIYIFTPEIVGDSSVS